MRIIAISWDSKNFYRPLIWLGQGINHHKLHMHLFILFRTPDDKLRWAFKMYDEDNSREIDIHEMERVMKVRNAAKLSIFRLFWNQCERTIGDGTSEP